MELGNLLSLPFNGGLLYVEPVYIRAAADGYPLLRKVLAGYGANVALEDTLAAALAKVLSTNPEALPENLPDIDLGGEGEPIDPSSPDTPTSSDPLIALSNAIEDAQAAYAAGQAALAEGDFAAYGAAQDDLQAALARIAAAEAILNPTPETTLPDETADNQEVAEQDGAAA